MIFKRATSEDLEELNTLLFKAKENTSWYQGQPEFELTRYMSGHGFTVENIKRDFVFKGILEDKIVAVFSFIVNTEELPLLDKFYLLPEYKGKGLGTIMWNETVRFAHEERWFSFIIISTEDAEHFYLNKGAVKMGKSEVTKGRSLSTLQYKLKSNISPSDNRKH